MRRAGEARLARADVGHAKIVVPDEARRVACRVALIVNKLDRHARLVLRRVNTMVNVPDDDRRAGRRLFRRHLDGHVRHRDARTNLNGLRDTCQVQHQRIGLRTQHDVLDQTRVVRVLDRAGERVAVAVHGEVRIREPERVGQDGVGEQPHFDGRRVLVHVAETDVRRHVHDLLAVVDDVVPLARRRAHEAHARVGPVERERVRDEAVGDVHPREDSLDVVSLHEVVDVARTHSDKQQVVADVRCHAVREGNVAVVVEDAGVREYPLGLASGAGDEIALDQERGAVHVDSRAVADALRAAHIGLAAVQDGDVRDRERSVLRLDKVRVVVRRSAVERDVRDRDGVVIGVADLEQHARIVVC